MKNVVSLISLMISGFILCQITRYGHDGLVRNVDRSFFIENIGQWPDEVLYLARVGGMNAWITRDGLVMDFYQVEGREKMINHDPVRMFDDRMEEDVQVKGHVVRMKWVGSGEPQGEGRGKREGYYNYFIGNDSSRWATYVGLYDEVMVRGIYPGVDVRYYFDGGKVRFDFELAAGKDLSLIRWVIEGSVGEEVVDNELRFRTRFGWVSLMDLRAFQGDKELEVSFNRGEGVWGLSVEGYDRSLAMVIDPLIWSTFLGGSGEDKGCSFAVDGRGNVYVTGKTESADYPVITGAYDVTYNGGDYDVFVTKLYATGSGLVYSTFIGGSASDEGNSLAIDDRGNVYIAGYTQSTNFPVTSNIYDATLNGFSDVFFIKLDSSSKLIYSTFIGGMDWDYATSLSIDNKGNVYIAGYTQSTNFPVTSNIYDATLNGFSDVFVMKLNSTGNELIYSTLIGGEDWDYATSLALDDKGNVYITGYTSSTNFPVTTKENAKTNSGDKDVFVTRLDSEGKELLYSMYIGGKDNDFGTSLVVDDKGNVFITGYTFSVDYPVTLGAYDLTYNGRSDVFVTKLNSDGRLIYSTFIGGGSYDYSSCLVVDGKSNVYLTGYTQSVDYPTTAGAYDLTYNGSGEDFDVFFTKLNPKGKGINYSSYLGGVNWDYGVGVAIDILGNVYVAGFTHSNDYPMTLEGYDRTYNGGENDIFVTKFDLKPCSKHINPKLRNR